MSDLPTPVAKPRMRILKRLGIGTAGVLTCFVLAVLVLSQLAARWVARVQPLSVEEVRQLMTRGSSPRTDDFAERAVQAESPSKESAGHAAGRDDETQPAEPRAPKALQLAALPTPDLLAREFEPRLTSLRWRALAFVYKSVWFGIYKVWGNAPIRGQSTGMMIARLSLETGNFASARSWFREGIRVENDDVLRRYQTYQLAWLEEDPEVAAALLEESFAKPQKLGAPRLPDDWIAAMNALDLCITTGSDDLAERYYLRFRDSWPWWSEHHRAFDRFRPEREAWIRNYEAKAASK